MKYSTEKSSRRDRPEFLLLDDSASSVITSCNGQTQTKEMGVRGCIQKVKTDTEGKGQKLFQREVCRAELENGGKKKTKDTRRRKQAEKEVVKLQLLKKKSKDRVSIGAEEIINVIIESKVNPCNEAEKKPGQLKVR